MAAIRAVAKEQAKRLPTQPYDRMLNDSDPDPLCFAIILARLEDALGLDYLSLAEDVVFLMTLRDFNEAYVNGAG